MTAVSLALDAAVMVSTGDRPTRIPESVRYSPKPLSSSRVDSQSRRRSGAARRRS